MSDKEFENYLRIIGKLLQLSRKQQQDLADELKDHLESRIEDLTAKGVDRDSAISQALDEFGDAAVMAKNFQTVSQLKRKRWMMRFATISTAVLFVAALLTMALWPDNARFGRPDTTIASSGLQDESAIAKTDGSQLGASSEDPFSQQSTTRQPLITDTPRPKSLAQIVKEKNQQIETQLRSIVDFVYDDEPWENVSSDLFDRFGIQIVVDVSAENDLPPAETININLREIPLEIGLVTLLRKINCTLTVKDGLLTVISIDAATDPEFLTTRVFDCRELIAAIDLNMSTGGSTADESEKAQPRTDSPDIDQKPGTQTKAEATPATSQLSSGMGGMPGMGGMGGMGMAGMGMAGMGAAPEKITRKDDILLVMLENLVNPDSWSDNGGAGVARIVNGNLVVTQTRDIHHQIEMFLDDLSDKILGPKKN